jgi:hypothetical protein
MLPQYMKKIRKSRALLCLAVLLLTASATSMAQQSFLTITGTLKDSNTGERICFATLIVPNTGIGSVSNSDGEFILKVDSSLSGEYLEISHLSYATKRYRISDLAGKESVIFLEIRPVLLKEIPVVPYDARSIVVMAFKRIKDNYSNEPNMMTGFYRETVQQRREYLSLSEAVVDIYKASYTGYLRDQVRIFKGRKGADVKKADTLMVRLQGGPSMLLLLDIVKNPEMSIGFDDLDNYRYEFAQMVTIDDKLNWVIDFIPDVVYEDPLYYGKLYISSDDYAITRIEFSLDISDPAKASRVFIRKKPAGLIFMPASTNYLVTYKEQNGTYYLTYARADLKFRCDWRKRLFKNFYTLMSELAITDRSELDINRFEASDVFRSTMVFTEKIEDLEDVGFWGEHNIIEPEESIEDAIRKISKSMRKQE